MTAEPEIAPTPPGTMRDSLLGIGSFVRQSGRASGTMTIGPWCRGPDSRPTYGCLGVLLDRLVGAALAPGIRPGYWPSTTEISATFGAALPPDGTVLEARSHAIETGVAGTLAEMAVRRPDGTPVAVGTGRILFTPLPERDGAERDGAESAVAARDAIATERPPRTSLLELLGARVHDVDGVANVELAPGPIAANPTGNVHGGVTLSLAVVAGLNAVQSEGTQFDVTGVHTAFLRPCPAVGIVRFVPQIVHRGRSLAVVHVRGVRADGRVSSVSTVSCARRSWDYPD